ncbi:peptidoglycan endopeptidase [Filibacter tadaridae]|uniref:D-gamma-glutamyl-meso-diaminopimelic acid endopeptidase CwlS n=1 Tax=Filibacter tadaridae TaxID=2483811 RepID=A0A3P5XFW8_9BACL|nr:peptidoglycan endopeptidase [Filibacter tadaridae]VDC33674.1 D-gamma-glutamyl-meso-diaminopimelic acid endopeptidase CwlS precursor [Filibacter tadaridae]
MKKVAFSALAAGSLALFVGVSDTEASSYAVQPGDSLWKVAAAHAVSVSDLKSWNQLTSDMIHPNQTLKLAASSTVVATKPAQKKPVKQSTTVESSHLYVVASGDTLSRIAQRHQTTVRSIQQLNGLSGDRIFAGQSLKVTGTTGSTPVVSKPAVPKKPAPTVSTTGTVRVVAGDTLSGIAYRQGITVTQLMNWNNLTSSNIRVGQVLKVENALVATQPNTKPVSAPVVSPSVPTGSGTVGSVISTATSLIGTPYVWGGSTARGFDCSGYIYHVYSTAGVSVPRTNTIGFDARSYEVSNPQVGDLVFFKDTYRAGISHMGIYLGNHTFIHAGGDRVQISSLQAGYWAQHFDSFKRLYAMN